MKPSSIQSKQNVQKVQITKETLDGEAPGKCADESIKTSPCTTQGRKRKLQLESKPDNSNAQIDCFFPAEKHRELVSSIFDIGVKESSPASILAHMTKKSKSKYDGLNLERIKSKLQKYRQSKERNKQEFMELYDKSMARFCKVLPASKIWCVEHKNASEIITALGYLF